MSKIYLLVNYRYVWDYVYSALVLNPIYLKAFKNKEDACKRLMLDSSLNHPDDKPDCGRYCEYGDVSRTYFSKRKEKFDKWVIEEVPLENDFEYHYDDYKEDEEE